MRSYISGGNAMPVANEESQRKRRVVSALMNPPSDVGAGLSSMGDAIAYRAQQKRGAFPKAPGSNPAAPFGRLLGAFGKRGLY